jgi:hypothetical protein
MATMPTTTRPPDIRLVLRPLPDSVPGTVRVRRALKTLLRCYRLKAVEVVEVPARLPVDGEATEGRTR